MAQAKTRDRTPPLNTSANSVTTHPDPVVNLSDQLFALWNADDASQIEYHDKGPSPHEVGSEVQRRFGNWQRAVATIISFTPATTLAGAAVQMAIALDALDSLLSVVVCGAEERTVRELRGVDEYEIERLIRSALRAVQKSVGPEFESVRGIVKIYAGGGDENGLDNVPKWAAEGRAERESKRE